MSRFTRYPFTLASNQPTSANYSSSAYPMINIDCASVQIDYSGSSATGQLGTFAIQGSNNYIQDSLGNILNSSATWANMQFLLGSSTITSLPIPVNPSPILFDIYGTAVNAVRLSYQGATSGFFTATITGKRLGG